MDAGARAQRGALVVVGAAAVLLIWSRLAVLGTSFWHDEAYTILNYVDRGPRAMLFGDYTPNNHLLFSLLSWATTRGFGQYEPAYRLWSVVPGLLAIALVGWWAWRRLGVVVGAAAVLLATVSPVHLELSPQARGYGIGFLAGAGMLVGAARAADRGRAADVAACAVFAAIGISTLPTIALPFIAHAAVVFLVRHDLRRATVVAVGIVATASVLFYAPVLDQLATSPQDDYDLPPLPWYGWASAPYSHLARPTLAALLPGVLDRGALLLPLAIGLGALGARRLWRRGDRALLANLVVPVVATYVVLVAGRVWFAPRYGSFLLFHVTVLLALGATEAWDLVPRSPALRALAAGAAAAVVLVGAGEVVQETGNEARVPRENFKFVGQVVSGTGIDRVLTNSTAPEGLWYYVGRARVDVVPTEELSTLLCDASAPFVYVDHPYRTTQPDLDCLRERGATRVHVTQEASRGPVDVWVLPGD